MATHPVDVYESFDDYISMGSTKSLFDVLQEAINRNKSQAQISEEGKLNERRET